MAEVLQFDREIPAVLEDERRVCVPQGARHDIFETGYPQAVAMTCDTSEPPDAVETYAAGGSWLQYDQVADRYTCAWKTQKAWRGYEFQMKLADGLSHSADFLFR